MEVVFIRHAQSHFNVYKASLPVEERDIHPLPGHRNCGITDHGIDQCAQLREKLHRENNHIFDAIVISPLKRTQETFRHLELHSERICTNALCREFAVHECDFLEDEEILIESKDDLLKRIETFKSWLLSEFAEHKRIAVISHGDFIHAMFEPHKNSHEESQFWLDNCQTIRFQLM